MLASTQLPIGTRLHVAVSGETPGEIHGFQTAIKEVDDENVGALIDLPPPASGLVLYRLLRPGATVWVEAAKPEGCLSFYAQVRHRQTEGLVGYWIALPQEQDQYEMVQRRQFVRVPVLLPVEISWQARIDEADNEVITQTVNGNIRDMSAGGLKVHVPAQWEAGTSLNVQFALKSTGERLQQQAEVRWGRILPHSIDDLHEYGLMFLNLDNALQTKLLQEVWQLQLARRHEQA